MRRTVAGIAVILLSAVALTGPLASAGQAGPATLQCATGTPPPACALLDKLAAQLKPVATILAPLSDAVGTAQGLAARSDSARWRPGRRRRVRVQGAQPAAVGPSRTVSRRCWARLGSMASRRR